MSTCNSCCHKNTEQESKFKISKNTKVWIIIFLFVLLLSYLIPQFYPLKISLTNYLKKIWWAVLIGFFISGIIEYFIPQEFIYFILGQKKKRTILLATFIGFLMSACSHGILAISIQLYKKGASIPAVIAFLLSSPWANLPVTFLLFSFFGWKAILFIVSAMLIAISTGLLFMLLDKFNLIEKSKEIETKETIPWRDFRKIPAKDIVLGVLKAAWELADLILWWLIVGLLIAAFIGAFVPTHIFTHYFGPSILGLFATLLFATVIEVCSEGSAPIAFEIFKKTGTIGNPFVFLMAGVATDYTEIGLLWNTIGKKTAIWLPIITIPQIIFLGIIFNLFVK